MKRWARWLAPAFVGAAAFVLTMTAGTAVAKQDGRPVDRVVMFASDGMRPDLMEKYAKAGVMPTYKKLMKDGVDRRQRDASRPSRRTPASAGTRWPPAPTRPSTARRTTRTSAAATRSPNRTSFSAAGVAAGGHDRERGRARRQEGRADRLGRWRGGEHRRADRRLHELLLEPRRARRRGGRGRAGRLGVLRRHLPGVGGPVTRRGLDGRPDGRSGGDAEGDDVDDPVHVRRAEPEPHLQRLLLRQRRRRRRRTTTTRSSARSARPARRRRST